MYVPGSPPTRISKTRGSRVRSSSCRKCRRRSTKNVWLQLVVKMRQRIQNLYRSRLTHGFMQATAPFGSRVLARAADAYEYLNGEETAELRRNFSLAFPHYSEREVRELILKYRRSTFESEYERKQLDMMPAAQLRDFCMKRIEIEGEEHFRAACETPGPVVLFTPHYGSFAIGTM